MSDKQKTAVQWLREKFPAYVVAKYQAEFDEAEAMVREQIIKANADGSYLQSNSITMKMCVDNAEEYYTETYGE